MRGVVGCAHFPCIERLRIFKSTQKKGLDGFWHNRVIGVFVPYVLFSVFQLGLSIVKGEVFGVENVFCTVTGLDFGLNLDPTMWYISYIFVCYAIFYVAWRFYRQRGAVSFVVVLLAFFVLMAIVGLTNSVWHRGSASWAYFWAFPAGVLLAMREERLVASGGSLAIFLLVGLSALVVVMLLYGTQHGSLNLFVYSAAGAVLVMLAVKILMDGPLARVISKTLRPVGEASYAMYLNEGFLIRLDACIPFVMGPVLTLVLSFSFAMAWNLIVSDRVTGWLKERWR